MREYGLSLSEYLLAGLRTDARNSVNVPGMIELSGMKPDKYGLIAPTLPQVKVAGNPVWPFPRIFKGQNTLYAARDGVRVLYPSATGDWTVSEKYVPQQLPGRPEQISTRSKWEYVEVGEGEWVLHTDDILARLNGGALRLQNDILPSAMAVYKGRLVMAGVDRFWNTAWTDYFDGLGGEYGTMGLASQHNWVFWGSVGGGDMLWDMLEGMSGGISEEAVAALERGDWGFMQLPCPGTVYELKQLGERLVAYGSEGIVMLAAVDGPVPTLGMKQALETGCKDCVGGGKNRHWFVDHQNDLWVIEGAEYSLRRLGYREFMEQLDFSKVVTSFNELEQELWVSDGEVSYCIGEWGVRQGEVAPTSGVVYQNVWGVCARQGAGDQWGFVTSEFDLGQEGVKMLGWVDIQVKDMVGVEVRVDANYGGLWREGRWVRVNPMGQARCTVSGKQFRIGARGYRESESARVDRLAVRWQGSDRRFRRGISAAEAKKE